jgi:nicotinamide riboside kinase
MPRSTPPALCIAVIGAESTGKTTLVRALAQALSRTECSEPGPRVAWVPEWLRLWCEAQGRTPRADEQRAIALEQHQRISAAAATHDIVVADTTALMTAVYSRLVFDDRSLEPDAVAMHREMHATLLTALDLPWVPDAHQRDGPHVREPVDDALRALLHAHGVHYSVVAGRGPERLAQAVSAISGAITGAAARHPTPSLFGSLLGADATAATAEPTAPRWWCDCCVPAAEQALQRRP